MKPFKAIGAVALLCVACASASGCAQQASAETASAYSVKVGDCVNDGDKAGTVTTVIIVPCSTSHDSEAFSSVELRRGSYPGATNIQTTATKTCEADFETFAGIAYTETKLLDFSWYHPTVASWKQGDRTILCFIESTNSRREPIPTVGTLRNAQR
jgi:hypothetical protein